MSPLRPACILVVEDDQDTCMLLNHLLSKHYELHLVRDVNAALHVARAHSFDLFLLDVNLGEERTGTDLLALLRALPDIDRIPALAVTAYALPGDRERLMHAGFDGYLSKPFTRQELLESIRRLLETSESPG